MGSKVLILLATHNRANLIIETLISIKNQTYTDFECFVTDDNSVDETETVINSFCIKDSRFHYFKKPKTYPKGLSATRNFGLDLGKKYKADFIQFFDDDDIMHPKKLELQIAPFLKDKQLDLTICKYRKFHDVNSIDFNLTTSDDGSCNIVSSDLLKSFFLKKINLNSLGPLWRAHKITKYRFNESLDYAEEREFYLKVFLKENINYNAVEYVLFWYRKHEKAITSNFYADENIKTDSEEKFQNDFLLYVLQQKRPPLYILRSYIKKSVIQHQDSNLWSIRKHLFSRYFEPNSIKVLVYSYILQFMRRM